MKLRFLRAMFDARRDACRGEVCGCAAEGAGADQASAEVALSALKPGQTGVIRETALDASDAALLRAMGLRPAATVRVCRLGEPCIIEVMVNGNGGPCREGCCRIGLGRPLADKVMVGAVRG